MQTTTEHRTVSILAQQTQRSIESAAKHGVKVLPMTVGSEGSLVVVYGIYRHDRMIARCTLYSDAAFVAEAVALYRLR